MLATRECHLSPTPTCVCGDMSFREFVEAVVAIPDSEADTHM